MSKPTLTIGIVVTDEREALKTTLKALKVYHGQTAHNAEFVVVDNNPFNGGKDTRSFCGAIDARYIPFELPKSISAARDEVFRQAKNDVVLLVSPGVLIPHTILDRLLQFAEMNQALDLWYGPMYQDNHSAALITGYAKDGLVYPEVDPRGQHLLDPPFDIYSQDSRVLACHRKAWLSSPSGLSYCGGDMLPEKFRRDGRRVICLPFLQWWSTKLDCRTDNENTFRNLLIWYKHLGIDETGLRELFRPKLGESIDAISESLQGIDVFQGRGSQTVIGLTDTHVITTDAQRVIRATTRRKADINAAQRNKAVKEKKGLGDLIEIALTKVGVTKERVEAFTGAPCGCDERKQKLNALSTWARRMLMGKFSEDKEAVDTLNSIIEAEYKTAPQTTAKEVKS